MDERANAGPASRRTRPPIGSITGRPPRHVTNIRMVKCTPNCKIQPRHNSIAKPTASRRGTKLNVCSWMLVIVCKTLTTRPTIRLTTSAGSAIKSAVLQERRGPSPSLPESSRDAP